MPEPIEKTISRRAFELWQQTGCPEGKDKEFCRQAAQELYNEKCVAAARRALANEGRLPDLLGHRMGT